MKKKFLVHIYLGFFPLLFGLLIFTKHDSKSYIILALILLILSDVIIFLSGERTAFVLLIIGTMIIIVLVKKWKYIRIISFIFSLLIIFLITSSNELVRDRMIDRTISQTNILGDKGEELVAFTPRHEAHYIISLNMFIDNPVFGIGPKLFRLRCSEEKYNVLNGCSTHPHNTYMQLLAETGVIGTLPLIILFLFICYKFVFHFFSMIIRKKYILSDFQICLYTSLFITLWPIVPSGNFFHNWLSIIFYLPIGFLLFMYKKGSFK